ncbi:LysE/ArgO family amino acid transporter [Thalassotalea piscium]
MISPLFQGFFLGASMILPIGAQNSHILNHGIKKNHHMLAATVCMLCDVILIGLGIFGGAKLISSSPLVFTLITWGGILFLLTYAMLSFKSAWQINAHNSLTSSNDEPSALTSKSKNKLAVLTTTLAITLLNPHVYLDTVMVLGSVGGQFAGHEKIAFAVGTMLASVIWFYSLAGAAAKLSPWLNQPKVQQVIDIIVGIVMCFIGYSLFLSL